MGAERHRRTKPDWRRELRARRRALDPAAVIRDGERLASHVLALPELGADTVVAAYLERPGEPSTAALLADWRTHRRRVLLPVVRTDLDLDWALDDASRRPGSVVDVDEPAGARLGVGAIASAAVVLVPALAVDRTGTRLGQGGGSYDRALARTAPQALVVALLHDDELVAGPLPVEPHDRPVDVVVCPAGVVRLRAPGSAPAARQPRRAPRPG